MKYILANWCLSNNMGDLITPYIIEKITDKKCIYAEPNSPSLKYVICGSILNWDIKNAIFWGPGIADIKDIVGLKDIRATRGPISKQRAIECGNNCHDAALGDPALLLPYYYYPKVKITNHLGILPHYVDLEKVVDTFGDRYKIINPLSPVEDVIREILSCESIISSSLHGLIISEAYGIKTQWVKFSDKIGGDGTKYFDHYSSIGFNNPKCIDVSNINSFDDIITNKKDINSKIRENLLNSCPFK